MSTHKIHRKEQRSLATITPRTLKFAAKLKRARLRAEIISWAKPAKETHHSATTLELDQMHKLQRRPPQHVSRRRASASLSQVNKHFQLESCARQNRFHLATITWPASVCFGFSSVVYSRDVTILTIPIGVTLSRFLSLSIVVNLPGLKRKT